MRILVVPGFSEEARSANTGCVNEIVRALKEMPGADVSVAGATLKKANPDVNWKSNPVFALKKIVNWPVIDPAASEQCYREIMERMAEAVFDAILVFHMPYDAVLAAVKAKKRNPRVKLMLYELDPITYEIDRARKSLGRYLYFLRERAERRAFDACDVIFHMDCNRSKYQHPAYGRYAQKSVYLDFPLIHDLKNEETPPREMGDAAVRLLYAGKLMAHFRSPEYLLKVVAAAHEYINLEMVFFSNGNCERTLEEYAAKYPFVIRRGFVDREALQKEIDACDCLVNIGNKISDMLPSKLLTYIETGKPIAHVRNQENDACVPYLRRYGPAVVLSEDEPVEQSARRLAEFLRLHYGEVKSSESIVKEFVRNTPEYSGKAIAESVNGR